MAKWVLPEGRKPLPDEWFAERAQMQDRIKGLEAKLAEYKHVASAIDTQWAESQDEIADLKAKLAKAEWLLVDAAVQLEEGKIKTRRNRAALIRQFLAELTGGKDE